MDREYFPKDNIGYYYYFRIKNIEEAKIIYNKCNGFMLGKTQDKAVIKEFMGENDWWESCAIYQKLYDDFNMTADKLINGEEIESTEDFKNLIHT